MFVSIETNQIVTAEALRNVLRAIDAEPIPHENMSCGYNVISVVYKCSKNDSSRIKNHWKQFIPNCTVVVA